MAPTDWSGSFVAWWGEEEAANATALADGATTCGAGTDCDLTDSNTVGRDTTNFVEAAKSGLFVGANNEYQSCADATCDELDCAGASVTFGAWIRPASLTDNQVITNNSGDDGYASLISSTGALRCDVGNTSINSAASALATSTWAHAVCRETDGTDLLQPFINGATSGTAGARASCTADTSVFYLSSNASGNDMDGDIDEAFVTFVALSNAQICRVCSLGINGIYGMCDGVTPTTYKACTIDSNCQVVGNTTAKCDTTSNTCQGRNHASAPGCGGCTLTACNAGAP